MEKISILLGKAVQKITRLKGNGGSALPGLVIEKTNPHFVQEILAKLPYGVVVISGTNGKTTTTKIVTELLQKQGLKVFTNETGSNFVRGVISAILNHIKLNGDFDYDIAVLELDEAHAVKFCEIVPINYALLLNVQRDQLDRFGEIDHTAELLQKVATKAKRAVILNREDPRVSIIKAGNPLYFGLSDILIKKFPSDDNLVEQSKAKASTKPARVVLKTLKDNHAVYEINSKSLACNLLLKGIYNAYNAAGALALCLTILPDTHPEEFVEDLAEVESAFGRGEIFKINNSDVELLLVKNPSAFQLSLASFADDEHEYMVAINDHIADGRDVSWLWNVDFSALPSVRMTAGVRATDMQLRLKYNDVKVAATVEDLQTATIEFLNSSQKPKRIFATYTAMLEIRKIIAGKSII